MTHLHSRLCLAVLVAASFCITSVVQAATPRFAIRFAPSASQQPLDGRLLLMISTSKEGQPRFEIEDGPKTQQIFGIDVDAMLPNAARIIDASALGYPKDSLRDIPAGTYRVQAVLHRYETFHRKDGHTVKLPMDRGEGQAWNRAPGNLFSTPQEIAFDPAKPSTFQISLDQVIAPIEPPPDTPYVKHERIQSRLLSEFWGRPMYIGAHVLLPEGWATHPEAHYPVMIFHGHFPADMTGWREQPPDPSLKGERSERFKLDDYNRTQQEYAYQLYQTWTGPEFPRVIVIEIQHANPYYDDSYAVDSANLGPYGAAIQTELLPYLEQKYRAIGQGWARFLYGGSTGGWESMAVQMFYPDAYNGAYIACPDPIDFHAYTVVNIYDDKNAYWTEGVFKRTPRPAARDYLGHIAATMQEANRRELVLGTQGRSGDQWDIWQAVFGPTGDDGYPKPIWDKRTGVIDPSVALYWKEHFDLVDILKKNWEKGLGEKLRGKLHLYVGEADNFYLNNAVYSAEEFLESTKNPPYEGEIDYGARAEHCWNGDHTRANAYSRLRYHQMFIPRAVERILKTAPAGADLTSWRY